MRKNLLKLFFIAFIGLLGQRVNAQTETPRSENEEVQGMGKNLLKISLTSLPLNSYSFIYERAIGKKKSFGIGVRYTPKGDLPLLNQIENLIDDPETFNKLKDMNTGNIAFTPEIKFYMGKGVFRGFYIAPFVRYAKYTASLPTFTYTYNHPTNGPTTTSIPLDGEMTTLTGGLLFGAQWKLSKLFYLDWSMLGPQYGSSDGSLKGTKTLNTQEQDALRKELQDLEIPLVETTTTVNSQGATLDFKGPWAGLRASIGLGIRF
jgi:hypothetical protein